METSAKFLFLFSFFVFQSTSADEPVWIDLLADINPDEHAVAGEWKNTNDGLRVNAAVNARLKLPYNVAGDYDMQVSFTRETGKHSVALLFNSNGQQLGFELDAWGQHLAGFQMVDGLSIKDNPSRVDGIRLNNQQRYTIDLQVRGGNITAMLDGNVIAQFNADGHQLSLLDLWELPGKNTLGIGAYDSTTVFHSIKVRSAGNNKSVEVKRPEENRDKTTAKKSKSDIKDDLSSLSDEFNGTVSINNWQRVFKTEGTNADQLQTITIDEENQQLVLIPYTSSWYQDYRGVLVYKPVTGNFIVSTKVQATGRNNSQPPNRQFSLAGIMVRTPRNITPSSWVPGQENYIFLSTGAANQPGTSQFEVKTTVNSDSKLEISPARSTEAEVCVARIGPYFILLKRVQGGDWNIHRRYYRPDMPETLQVGMTVYTDWQNVEHIPPQAHNRQVIKDGLPDLEARFDYFRFKRPDLSGTIDNTNLADPNIVSDQELLKLFRFKYQ